MTNRAKNSDVFTDEETTTPAAQTPKKKGGRRKLSASQLAAVNAKLRTEQAKNQVKMLILEGTTVAPDENGNGGYTPNPDQIELADTLREPFRAFETSNRRMSRSSNVLNYDASTWAEHYSTALENASDERFEQIESDYFRMKAIREGEGAYLAYWQNEFSEAESTNSAARKQLREACMNAGIDPSFIELA